MTLREAAAVEFVFLWEYLRYVYGEALALADLGLQAARRAYILACA